MHTHNVTKFIYIFKENKKNLRLVVWGFLIITNKSVLKYIKL